MSEQEDKYPAYPVFKGLQRPFEAFGLRGRYVFWGLGTVAGTLLSFLGGYAIFGFLLSLIISGTILGVGGVLILVKQHKGLHTKNTEKGLFIVCSNTRYSHKKSKTVY